MVALEQIARGNSAVHRLSPLVKLISAFGYIVIVLSFGQKSLGALMIYLLYPSVMIAIAEIPVRQLAKRLMIALPFPLLAGISNIVFDRVPVFTLGCLVISGGMVSFLTILIKTCLTVTAVLILVSTTPLSELSGALVFLKAPPVMIICITMIYRYIAILIGEASRMYSAYMLRSPDSKGIRIRDMGSFLGQLLLRSFERAERVYAAMKLHGYDGGRLPASRQRFAGTDFVFSLTVIGVSLFFRFVNIAEILGNILI